MRKLIRETLGSLLWGASAVQIIAKIVLIAITLIIITEVIGRTFGKPMFVLEELGGIAFAMIIFTGMSTPFVERKHLRVAILMNLMPDKARQVLEFFLGILALIFCIYTTVLWGQMTYVSFKAGSALLMMEWVIWPTQLAALLGWIALDIAVIDFTIKQAGLISKPPPKEGGKPMEIDFSS
ncbi:TRAP transporter small permease [Chloroflexota bacterium]